MAVTSETNRVQYTGNNSTVTAYTVPFYFLESSHVVVVVTDDEGTETTLTSGQYTVTGAGDDEGGSLTTATAYDNTHTVTITRVVPLTQPTIYEENTRFPASSHERALDRLTMQVQQMQRKLDRCIAATDVAAAQARLAISGVTNQFLGVNSSGAFGLLTALQAQSILELQGSLIDKPTAFWADAGARAAKVPDFEGQIGLQLDTNVLWRSDGTSAGDWVECKAVPDGYITTAKLASQAVTGAKVADETIGYRSLVGDGFFRLESAGPTVQTLAATDYLIEWTTPISGRDPLDGWDAGDPEYWDASGNADPFGEGLDGAGMWLLLAILYIEAQSGAWVQQAQIFEGSSAIGPSFAPRVTKHIGSSEACAMVCFGGVFANTGAGAFSVQVQSSQTGKEIAAAEFIGVRIGRA